MKKPLTFIHRQKINFILYVFLEILQRCCKLVVLGTLGIPGYVHPNWYYQLVETFMFISAGEKNQIHPPCFSGDIAKICKLFFFFWCFGHAWLHTPKMIVSTCRRLQCLAACQKYTSLFTSFLRYYILKNSAIWLADNILVNTSRARILPGMGLVVKYQQQY